MADRPFLEPTLRLIVTTPRTLRELTASEIDSLTAEINKRARENDISIGQVTLDPDNPLGRTDTLIFGLHVSTTDFQDFVQTQQIISDSMSSILDVPVDERDFTVDAEILRTFGLRD